MAIAHRLEVAGREALEAPERTQRAFGGRETLDHQVVAVVLAVHRDRRRETDRHDAGHLRAGAPRPARCVRAACCGSLMSVRRDRDDERLDLLRAHEARIDLSHRDERPNHQPRDDQQRQRQRDLTDDQRIARAMPCPGASLAERPPSLSAAMLGVSESQDREQAEQRAAEHRDAKVNSRTVGSMPISSTRGSSAGAIVAAGRVAAWRAPRRPRRRRAPARRSRTAARARCGRGWRRARTRIASSCWRPSARTRNRLATLPQAISSTTPTAARRIQRISPTSPITSSASGRTFGCNSSFANAGGSSENHARDIGVGLGQRDARLQAARAPETRS